MLSKELFSEKLTQDQETEFYSRLFFEIPKSSYKILNTPLFLYRQHDNRKSNKNLKYIKSFKESQSYTAIEILKKSIKLNDVDLANQFYKNLIDAFYRSIENKHNVNAKFILKNLGAIIKPKNKSLGVEFVLLGNLFLFLSRGSYKIEKYWKSKKIKV